MSEPVLVLDKVRADADAAVAHVVVHPGQVALLFGRGRFGPLMECVLGQAQPYEGVVTLLGTEVTGASPDQLRLLRARVGVLPERVALLSHLSVFDNVALPMRYHDLASDDEVDTRVRNALEFWGLGPVADARPPLEVFTSLRVGLVRCLVADPKLVVLQNPFERVDDDQRGELDRLVEALHGRGAGVLVIDA